MTAIERTAYPRFKAQITDRELEHVYKPTDQELVFVNTTAKGAASRLRLMVLLKTCLRLGYFPNLQAVPRRIVDYIRSQMSIGQEIILSNASTPTNLTPFYRAVRTYLGIKPYREGGEAAASAAVQQTLATKDNPADIINVVIEELIRQNFNLPGFTTLDRLVAHPRTHYNQDLFSQVSNRLSETEKQRLDQLLFLSDNTTETDFNVLKQPPLQRRASLKCECSANGCVGLMRCSIPGGC